MLRIAGGRVYDPANGIAGEVGDVCVQDGRIVADVPAHARSIDARGMVVMPGGVDIHAHIAGPAVNAARKLAPEEHRADALLFQVQRDTEDPVREFEHLAGHRLLDAVDPGDAVTDRYDGADFGHVDVNGIAADLVADDFGNFFGFDVHYSSGGFAPWSPHTLTRGDPLAPLRSRGSLAAARSRCLLMR